MVIIAVTGVVVNGEYNESVNRDNHISKHITFELFFEELPSAKVFKRYRRQSKH